MATGLDYLRQMNQKASTGQTVTGLDYLRQMNQRVPVKNTGLDYLQQMNARDISLGIRNASGTMTEPILNTVFKGFKSPSTKGTAAVALPRQTGRFGSLLGKISPAFRKAGPIITALFAAIDARSGYKNTTDTMKEIRHHRNNVSDALANYYNEKGSTGNIIKDIAPIMASGVIPGLGAFASPASLLKKKGLGSVANSVLSSAGWDLGDWWKEMKATAKGDAPTMLKPLSMSIGTMGRAFVPLTRLPRYGGGLLGSYTGKDEFNKKASINGVNNFVNAIKAYTVVKNSIKNK